MNAYRLHPDVVQDVDEICSFIEQDSLRSAVRVREKLFDSFQLIAETPGIGHLREDLTSRHLRFWVVYNYLIAYAPNLSPLPILAVLHGRRDPKVLQVILQSRKE